jgi:glycosyltransferase involved in cell wall biosynthesis
MILKLSVIVSVHNRETTIGRALGSIKSQTYTNIEIVFIDAASTDHTLEIALQYLKENDVLISEPDSGIYEGLNKGISNATGDVICFLHSDDLFHDDHVVQDMMRHFNLTAANIVYGDITFFSPKAPDRIRRIYKSPILSVKNLAWGLMPAHPGLFIRRELYASVGGFIETFKIAADYEFCCRLAKCADVNALKLNRRVVKMQIGGISTANLRSKILLNIEVIRALRANSIDTNILMIMSKYVKKFFWRIF